MNEISNQPVMEKLSPKEYKKRALQNYRQCWSPSCRKYAWLRDWAGWKWCWKHWYRHISGKENYKWYFIRSTKIEIYGN